MKKNYPALTMSHLQKLCRKGEIRINGKRIDATEVMFEKDQLKLPPFITEYQNLKNKTKNFTNYSKKDIETILNSIIYENNEFLVLNKPSGIASQGGDGITKHIDTLINAALPKYNNNLRLTHRIDKDTSGILLIAKNYESANLLTTMFKEHKIKKTYHALIYGNLDKNIKTGIINNTITDKSGNEKYAITKYTVIDEAYNLLSLIELSPETGRTHQLRIHMENLGRPIIGDFKYGDKNNFIKLKSILENNIERKLYLHAYKIEIDGYKPIIAPYPKHFLNICKYLNF